MSVQSQTDQWNNVLRVEEPNATQRDLLPSYGWTEAWFASVFLPWLPVRESRQEAEALRNFARGTQARRTAPEQKNGPCGATSNLS